MSSSSSLDESDVPSLDMLKSSHVQMKVDRRIKDLNQSSRDIGKLKYKSLRGGDVDVQVRHKVHWPHEAILSGVTRQRVAYDQLSLTQWVHGFCKNILEEKSESRKDSMISYLGDLMEDATDFSWQGAKAAHAVLLCEMERGSLSWEELGGLMPRSTSPQVNKIGVGQTRSPGFARTFKPTHAPIRKITR